jgi:hypothetical protein
VVGLAPACTVAVLALAAAPFVGHEVLLLGAAALPLAYGTLFFSVLPALSILRRLSHETFLGFVTTVAGSTFVPWATLAAIYLLVTPQVEHPPLSLVATVLAATAAAAASAAAVIWSLTFRGANAA